MVAIDMAEYDEETGELEGGPISNRGYCIECPMAKYGKRTVQ
jgi:hypothetical protein